MNDSKSHSSHKEIKLSSIDPDIFNIVLENNYGDRIENGWVSLSIRDTSVKTLGVYPALYIEYEHQGNGRYTASIEPYRLKDKSLTLSAYAENHDVFEADFELLELGKRIVLNRKKSPG